MMVRIQQNGVLVSLWLALTLCATARSAVAGGLGGALLALFFWAVVQGAGLWYARKQVQAPPRKLTDGIAMIGLLAFLAEMLFAGILSGLMSLLLWLQAARNPGLATRRDVYFGLVISLTLMTYAASEARSSAFLLLLVPYGLAVLSALVYCHQQSGLAQQTGETHASTAQTGPSLSVWHLGALAAIVFSIGLVWYLLVPRPAPINFGAIPTFGGDQYSRSDWEREAKGELGQEPTKEGRTKHSQGNKRPVRHDKGKGQDDTLDILNSGQGSSQGDQSQQGQSANRIMMYVQSDRPLYLRRKTFDQFADDRWHNSIAGSRKLLPETGKFSLLEATNPAEGEAVRYTVQIVSEIGSELPLSAHANEIEAPAGVIAVGNDRSVLLPNKIEPGFRYAATSVLPKEFARPVLQEGAIDRSLYLQLSENYSQRIGELAQQVSAHAIAPFDKALALEAHLRNHYAYSFETVFTSQNLTPLDAFLFETRRGHCEFFASAMAVMLRSLGIPSRVVHGYLAHKFNPVTGFYEVQAFDGHAWVEAYFNGMGWVTFEPTAAYPVPERTQQSGTALFDLKAYTEKLAEQEMLQGKASLTTMVAAALQRLVEVWHLALFYLRLWLDALDSWLLEHRFVLSALCAGSIAVIIAGYLTRMRVLWLWARLVVRFSSSSTVALIAFKQIERIAAARTIKRLPSETIDDYLARIEGQYGALHNELRLLKKAFNRARYGAQQFNKSESSAITIAFLKIGDALIGKQPIQSKATQ